MGGPRLRYLGDLAHHRKNLWRKIRISKRLHLACLQSPILPVSRYSCCRFHRRRRGEVSGVLVRSHVFCMAFHDASFVCSSCSCFGSSLSSVPTRIVPALSDYQICSYSSADLSAAASFLLLSCSCSCHAPLREFERRRSSPAASKIHTDVLQEQDLQSRDSRSLASAASIGLVVWSLCECC